MIQIIVTQIAVMFVLILCGYLLFRSGKVTADSTGSLGNLLIYVSLPCVIFRGFLQERTAARSQGLLISAAAAFGVLLISVLVSRLCFRKDAVAAFGGAFSNPGFFGVPVISALLGSGAVSYIAAFIAFLNILQWTVGVSWLKGGKEKFQITRLLKAPFLIATVLGLIFYLTGLSLPGVLDSAVSLSAGLNTPLSMFLIGAYLAQTDLRRMFTRGRNYLISAVRLVLIPALAVGVLCLVPGAFSDLRMAVLIAAACPVGANIAVYAQQQKADYAYAVESVVVSTLLSVITMPLMARFATAVLERIGL